MPRNSKQNAEVREARKAQILDAALSVYVRCGYHGSDMDVVADEARLAKGLLYYYYKSKNALFAELFTQMFDKASALSNVLMEEPLEPVEQLMRYTYGMYKANNSDPRLMQFLLRAPFDAAAVFGAGKWREGSKQSKSHGDAVTKIIERGIERGVIPAVDAASAAGSFWSVFVANLFTYSKLIMGEKSAERRDFREIVRFCFQGLGIEQDLWGSCLERVQNEEGN